MDKIRHCGLIFYPLLLCARLSDELMRTFDRARDLRAEIAKLKAELGPLEKQLVWRLMPEAFGEHWGPHAVSPADSALDGVRHAPIGAGTYLDQVWPLLQRDRQTMLEAHADWKQRRDPK
jgi:hypothetical protein